MTNIEFAIRLEKRFKDADLNDPKTVNDINYCIKEYLKTWKRGETFARIYELKSLGLTQANIAEECEVSKDITVNCIIKIRRLIDYIQAKGIDLPQFEKFTTKKYNYSEETIAKQREKRNNVVEEPKELSNKDKARHANIVFANSMYEEYKDKNLKDDSVLEEFNNRVAEHLKNWKNGQSFSQIYLLKCSGVKNADIARECGISRDVVFNRVTKLERFIRYFNLELPQFENFKTKDIISGSRPTKR